MKSGGDRSGEWGAHGTSVFRLMSLPGKRVCSHIIVALAVCGVAPSCWNHCSLTWIPGRCLIASQKGVRARLMYRSAVMVTASSFSSSKKKGPIGGWPCRMAAHTVTFVEWSGLCRTMSGLLSLQYTAFRLFTWPHNQKWASSENHVLSHTSGFSWNHYAIFTRFSISASISFWRTDSL